MRIQTVPCLSDNLSYLVVDDESRTCVAIDPGEARPFQDALRDQNLELIAILATHHHYDHVGGLSQMPEVPVWSSKRDLARIPGAGASTVRECFNDAKSFAWSDLANRRDNLKLRDSRIRLTTMSIPGHTEGQVAIIFKDEATSVNRPHVFVGDTLFALGCGRCLEGTPETLFESLQKLKALPPDSVLYFGHEYTEKNALFWLSHRKNLNDPRTDAFRFDADFIAHELEQHITATRASRAPKTAPKLSEELARNPFLQILTPQEFRRWRELRNTF